MYVCNDVVARDTTRTSEDEDERAYTDVCEDEDEEASQATKW